jgi:hypothetical protein
MDRNLKKKMEKVREKEGRREERERARKREREYESNKIIIILETEKTKEDPAHGGRMLGRGPKKIMKDREKREGETDTETWKNGNRT